MVNVPVALGVCVCDKVTDCVRVEEREGVRVGVRACVGVLEKDWVRDPDSICDSV